MKRTGIIILVIIAALALWGITVRNGLATAKKDIDGKWGQVENQFQRKMKLYDNVVNTIKASGKFEDSVLTKIVAMRSRVPQIDANNPQSLAAANKQLDMMKGAIINVNVEAYPTLQTPQAFRDFQSEIERTESRVTTAIMDWNNGITDYNKKLVKFPNNLIAGMMGYKEMANYKADDGAKDAKVDFNK